MLTKEDLIAFEKEVAKRWEAGEIKSPIHLGGGNEDQLIEVFKNVKPTDWILASWRSHYHALLHGISPDEVMRQILAGKSMSINSVDPPFYSSSIAGGICPIAVGLGMAIKRRGEERQVWIFCGDMTSECGIFWESAKYARNFDLPVTFVIESNGKSVLTPTEAAWGAVEDWSEYFHNVRRYEYELSWPHSGTGVHGALIRQKTHDL